jgi:hypothetical protein
MKRSLLACAALSLIVGVATLAGPAFSKDQLLGTAVYEAKPNRDVIAVGAREGAFKAIRLEVLRSEVEILDLTVVYGNNTTEDLRVRQVIKAGGTTRAIDLAGYKRAIKQVIITYVARGPARINVIGVEAGGGVTPPATALWERLGCKDVGFLIDRDTLVVGKKEGRFSAIRLKVRKAPVELFGLRIVFGNGGRQDVPVRALIPAGGESRPLSLSGDNRGIDRIEMLYRAVPSFKGTAELCFDGLQK